MPGLVEIVSGRLECVDTYTGVVVGSRPVWFVLYYDEEGRKADRYAEDDLWTADWKAREVAMEKGANYIK